MHTTVNKAALNRTVQLIYVMGILSTIVVVAGLYWLVTYILPDPLPMHDAVAHIRQSPLLYKAIAIVFALSTLPIMWQSGETLARLWHADSSPRRRLSWIATVSELIFFAAFFVGIGLAATAIQLHPHTSDDVVWGLFGASAITIALCGLLWIPFGVAALTISLGDKVFPSWLNAVLLIAVIMNAFGFCGMFTLEGIFNPFNGAIAAGLPFYGPSTFIIMSLAWGLAENAKDAAQTPSR